MKRISMSLFIFFSLAAMEHETSTEEWQEEYQKEYNSALAEAKTAIEETDQSLKLDILLSILEHERAKRPQSAPKIYALVDLLMS